MAAKPPKNPNPIPNKNMGRVQQMQPGWRDHGSSEDREYLRGNELSDREEREAYGRDLPAAYRYLIGPTPKCLPSDRITARSYLTKIEHAIEVGGWTRSEWRRLHGLKNKWKARANGQDARFNLIGNKSRGLNKQETANVRDRRIVQQMIAKLQNSGRSNGD